MLKKRGVWEDTGENGGGRDGTDTNTVSSCMESSN